MATAHTCNVDCQIVPIMSNGAQIGTAHQMHAAEPSSAAGRYQWEQNAAIRSQGRRAWRASGQGQSRECRVWDERRRTHPNDYLKADRVASRRFSRELREMDWVN